MGIRFLDFWWQRVSISYDGIGHDAVGDECLCGSIAADDVRGVFQHFECSGVSGIVSCSEDDSIIISFHLKYP